MANSDNDGLLGGIIVCVAFLCVVVYMVFILPFKSQDSLRRSEQNHRANIK